MKPFDVITVGNCMIDAFMAVQQDNLFSSIDKEQKKLSFTFGEKIHVESCTFMLGGNACNVGVGLSRLGLNTGLMAEIGDDEFSQKILHLLAKEKIDSSLIVQTKGEAASFAIGINFSGERTLFVDHVKRHHNFSTSNIQPTYFYLTSLGTEWKTAYQNVLDAVHGDTKLALSPGTHQIEAFLKQAKYKEEHELLVKLLKKTTLLCINKEEGERIAGVEKKEIKDLLKTLQAMGPQMVSITDGGNGAYSIDTDGIIRGIEKFPNNPVEKTGAGDAYATGFLGAIVSGHTVPDAMRWGSVNAASVVGKVGAQTGLLTKQELEKTVTANPDFTPQEIT